MKQTYFVLALTIITSTLVGFYSLQANWSPSTATPPGNNVPPPINTGTSSQEKDGALAVGGLAVFGATYIQGASTSEMFDGSVTLEVEGKIGADAYCDENGENCVNTLGQVVTGDQDYGASLVAGWPDMILCNTYTNVYPGVLGNPPRTGAPYQTASDVVFHRDSQRISGNRFIYRDIDGGQLVFNIDGTSVGGGGAFNLPGECTGKSLTQLSSEGRTYAYGVSRFNYVSNVRYIAGGHALTQAMINAGIPGIAHAGNSSIGHRANEMAWVCNYFHPGSTVVGSRQGAYSSPSDNGIHLLNASGTWQRFGASAYNSRIDGLYCRLAS